MFETPCGFCSVFAETVNSITDINSDRRRHLEYRKCGEPLGGDTAQYPAGELGTLPRLVGGGGWLVALLQETFQIIKRCAAFSTTGSGAHSLGIWILRMFKIFKYHHLCGCKKNNQTELSNWPNFHRLQQFYWRKKSARVETGAANDWQTRKRVWSGRVCCKHRGLPVRWPGDVVQQLRARSSRVSEIRRGAPVLSQLRTLRCHSADHHKWVRHYQPLCDNV